jgi:hypothetical protein
VSPRTGLRAMEKRRQRSGYNERTISSAKHYTIRLIKKGIKREVEK